MGKSSKGSKSGGSEDKLGFVDKLGTVDLARANLLRKSGLKITPALREYYRYTGISAEVERHGHPENEWPSSEKSERPAHD